MATYVPNANQTAEPVESQTVESAALEFRTLKKHALQFLTTDADTSKTTLPAATARAGKFLAFDSITGEPVTGPDIVDWTITQDQIADVETVATNMADVNLVVDNMTALNNLSDAVTNGDLLTDVYQGAHAAAPVLRLDGSALQTGDLYFNTTNSQMFTYDGASWIDYEAAAVAAQLAAETAETNAETAQAAAELAETHAETAEANAETAETGAVAAKVAAEAARDAAIAAANTYTTTAAGIAATTSGQVFLVSTASAQVFTVYSNAAGVATLIGTLNIADGSVLVSFAPKGYAFTIFDATGDCAVGVKDDGTFAADAIEANSISLAGDAMLTEHAPAGFVFSILDSDENAAMGVKEDGTFVAGATEFETMSLVTLNGVPVDFIISASGAGEAPSFLADINHIETYGQSLSIGTNTGSAISTTQPYDSLEFDVGLASFSALIEPCLGGTGETPSAGTAQVIKELIANENGISYTQQSYQVLMSNNGTGATTLANLSKTKTPYTNVMAAVQAGYTVSQGLNKTYNFPCITLTQGEADYEANTALETYKTTLLQLRTDLTTDAQAITGQSNVVKLICYQTATHKFYSRTYPSIALAQLKASVESADVHLACPLYMIPYSGDNVHLTASSSKILGFYYGLAYKRVIVDGSDWQPLRPISKYKQGKVANIKFNVPHGKLVFDTSQVSLNTNYGFNLFDSSNVAITIDSVTITGPDTIRIVAATSIPAGAKLQYAFYGATNSGPISGPRGNLRDTQGNTLVFDPSGLNYKAHNWCVMFEETF